MAQERGEEPTWGSLPFGRRLRRLYRRVHWFGQAHLGRRPYEALETVTLPQRDLVFLVTSKCGCTSVKHAFIRSVEPGWQAKDWRHIHARAQSDIPGTLESKHFLDPETYRRHVAGRAVFAVVRDPVTRLVSAYVDLVTGNNVLYRDNPVMGLVWGIPTGVGFSEFLSRVCATPDHLLDRHLRPQWASLAFYGQPSYSFLLRMEHLATDWARRPELAGLPIPERHNVGPRSLLDQVAVSPDDRARIRRRFARDVEVWEGLQGGGPRGATPPMP